MLATVPLGYADGVTRRLSAVGGEVLIGGRRCPIAGTVTMDQIIVDCGPDATVAPGDEVVLIGRQGDEEITADEWAARLDTISYEILCGIGPRVPTRPPQPVITDVAGVRVGHWTDEVGRTGCTVVLLPEGTVASGEVRGGAPGTREFDLLAPERTVARVDAVVLTGGSAFGLAACDGVMRWCEERGLGFPTAGGPVPIVVGAVLYDLMVGDAVGPARTPTRATRPASPRPPGPFATGAVGAGTGATVGKWRGREHARPGGVGTASLRDGEPRRRPPWSRSTPSATGSGRPTPAEVDADRRVHQHHHRRGRHQRRRSTRSAACSSPRRGHDGLARCPRARPRDGRRRRPRRRRGRPRRRRRSTRCGSWPRAPSSRPCCPSSAEARSLGWRSPRRAGRPGGTIGRCRRWPSSRPWRLAAPAARWPRGAPRSSSASATPRPT